MEAALLWIERYGDRDGDGFVEYHRQSADGLVHQGWRDSDDAVFHADGSLAQGPIALCEVQGYAFAALRAGATLALALGQSKRASQLAGQAEVLKKRFEQAFWCQDLSTYALALDGRQTALPGPDFQCRPVPVHGHRRGGTCLARGPDLVRPELFSGWGVRTVAASEVRYNPMAYHNGSVWPHDNALIAHGLTRFGLGDLALQVLTGMFEAGLFFELHRMPELFCGFAQERRRRACALPGGLCSAGLVGSLSLSLVSGLPGPGD